MLLPLVLGCVSKGDYELVRSQQQQSDAAIQTERKRNAELQNEKQLLQERLSQLQQQNDRLRNANQLLVDKNSMLSDQLLELRGDILEVQKQAGKREKALELASQTYEDLVHSLKQEVTEGKVTIQKMRDRLQVMLIDRILFPAGSVQVNDTGKRILDKVATILKKITDKRIQVEGHSDDSAVSPSVRQQYPTNWEISARRATEVVRYLEQQGVNPKLLAAVALSHHHPIASNKSSEGRRKNRRIEIVLLPLPQISPAESK